MDYDPTIWLWILFTTCFCGSITNSCIVFKIINDRSLCCNNCCLRIRRNSPNLDDKKVTRVITKVIPKIQHIKSNKSHYQILLCLFGADFIFCTIDMWVYFLAGIAPQYFTEESWICKFQGVGTMICASSSVMFLCLLAYDRFHSIVYQKKISSKRTLFFTSLIILYSSTLGFILLIPPLKISIGPCQFYCTTEWFNRNIFIFAHSITCIATLVFTISLTGLFYSWIYIKVSRSARNVEMSLTTLAMQTKQNNNTEIAYRMSILVVCFIIGWGTYLSMIVTSLYYQIPVSPIYEVVANFLASFHSAINPLIYQLMKKNRISPTFLTSPLSAPSRQNHFVVVINRTTTVDSKI